MSRPVLKENGGKAHERDSWLWLSICSGMFSEDSKIPIEDLVIIGMGLKLFEDRRDITNRYRVQEITENLRYHHGNVLRVVEDEYDKQYVEMLVSAAYLRELIDLRNSYNPVMFQREIIMENWLNTNGYKHCRGLSLVLKRLSEFPVILNCPELSVLLLKHGEDSTTPPCSFFKGMKNLRVLSLDVPSMPYSLNMLKNLQTLRLKVFRLKNMSVIGGLVNLEFLLISTSSSIDIPRVIGQLENLKVVDLRKTNLSYISPGVFTRMLKLEELYLPLSFNRWGCRAKEEDTDHYEWDSGEEDQYDDEERINASLSELFSPSLNAIHICIPNASLLPRDLPTYNIWRFEILGLNNRIYQPFHNSPMNILQLTGDACDIKGSGICNVMNKTEHLSLTRVKNLKNLAHDLKHYHFRWLKEVIISECDELEYIFDVAENYTSFSMLEVLKSLHISMLSNLKEIWHGTHIGGFQDLTQINIRFCPKLKYVFPLSMAVPLKNLKRIEILDCAELEGIFKAGVDYYPYEFSSLEELYLHSLPKLVGFLMEKDYTNDAVYDNANQSLTNNEAVSNSMNLEAQITGFDVTSRSTSNSQWKNKLLLYTQKVVHSKLKVSVIKNKDVISPLEMYCAFSSKLLEEKRLGNLKKLTIAFCDSLRVIFSCKGMGNRKHKFNWVLDSLRELELFGLRNLVHIWFQVPSKTLGFQNLQLLVLVDCHNLYLFSPPVANLLVQLQKIQISRCEMMGEIVAEEKKKKVDKIVFHQLRAMEFQHMPNLKFFYDGISAIELPLLESLKLNQCNKMETFSHGSLYTPILERIQLNGSMHSTGRDLNATVIQWMENVKAHIN